MPQQRIAYIDFMKCLCIMLIVMYHIDHEFFNYLAPNLNNALQAFRLPMYYFISGIFFKLYDGFADFTRRKVNNILVPFVFFVILAYGVQLLEYAARFMIGAQPIDINPIKLIEPFYQRYWQVTTPLWFLLSLFWVNIIFYALQCWIKPVWGLVLATLAISLCGYWLCINKVELPLMLDTSMVALPYFVLGWLAKRVGALQPSRLDRWGIVALLLVALPIYWLSDFMNLHFQVLPAYWKLYLLPFVAILAFFWACNPQGMGMREAFSVVIAYVGAKTFYGMGAKAAEITKAGGPLTLAGAFWYTTHPQLFVEGFFPQGRRGKRKGKNGQIRSARDRRQADACQGRPEDRD